MKQGKTLVELATELQRQNAKDENGNMINKRDFLVNTQAIGMNEDGQIQIKDMVLGTTETFDGQMASKLEIPKKYYDKMKNETPMLLSQNVNFWLQKEADTKMIRTLDGKARAFLSERYRPLDNYDLLETSLPIIQQNGCEVISSEVTPDRLYLKALMPKLEAEIKKGDLVQAGICISNSETGLASLRVEPLIYRLVCTNGMIANTSMKKYHVGRGQDVENFYEILSDKTKAITDAAFWLQVKDIITSAFNKDIFEALVNKMRDSTQKVITQPVGDVIEVVQKKYAVTDKQGQSIMEHLLRGNDLTQYGLVNAITRTAEDQVEYHQATQMERFGGEILDLSATQWANIAA